MKKGILGLAILASVSFIACNDTDKSADETTATDSPTDMPSTMKSGYEIQLQPDAEYIDLNTGKPVKLRVDTVTRYIVFAETSEPVTFFVDPTKQDTFDVRGQNVSDVLIKTDAGYVVDESKWKIKRQSDGDWKMKDGEGNKIKIDPNDDKIKMKSADGSVEKIDGNKYKSKTDSTKEKSKH